MYSVAFAWSSRRTFICSLINLKQVDKDLSLQNTLGLPLLSLMLELLVKKRERTPDHDKQEKLVSELEDVIAKTLFQFCWPKKEANGAQKTKSRYGGEDT